MREWYEFNRDAVKAFLDKPIVESIVGFVFVALVFFLLYMALWIVCPC